MYKSYLSVLRPRKLTLLLVLFFSFYTANISAQIISYPSAAQPITRGLDSTLLTVRIDFPACTNPQVTIHLGASNNAPGVISYIPGSITKIGGTPALSITESNIGNLRQPVFSVTSPAVGEFIIFTIKRKANCGEAAASKDSVVVSGGCNFSESDVNVNTYNLLAPALTMVPPANISNVTIGDIHNRTITVTNGGNGCMDTLGFWVKYAPGEMQLNNLRIGATTLMPAFQNADSAYFLIHGTLLGNDKLFCNGETIVFTENTTVLRCNTQTNYGAAWYSYEGDICQSVVVIGGITMNNNIPTLVCSMPKADKYDYCFNSDTKIQTIQIVNTGAGPAGNIELELNPSGFMYFDTTTVWPVKNSAGIVIGTYSRFTNIGETYGYDASCAFQIFLGRVKGKLSDNIILAAGDTLYIEVVTRGMNVGCSQWSCAYKIVGHLRIESELTYKNQCGNGIYTENSKVILSNAYTYYEYTQENPTDINGYGPNNTFNLSLDFSNFRSVNHPGGNGITRLAVPLAGTGLSPTVSSVTLGAYTFPVSVINDTMFVGPVTQNIQYLTGRMIIPMQADCNIGGGGLKTINSFFLNQYDACSPILKMSCTRSTITVHCLTPCPAGGATPTLFTLRRVNYGLPDNDNNGIPDASGSVNLSLVNDHNSVNGDTLSGTWRINIYPNNEVSDPNVGNNFNYVYIDFELGAAGLGAPATLNALPGANAEIWRSGINIANLIANPSIIGTKAHYEFNGNALPGGAWLANDSIVINARYTVNQYNGDRYGAANLVGSDLFVTANEVYSTYVQKTTPQIGGIPGETYTCEHYNDYSQICRIWLGPLIGSLQAIEGCSNQIISATTQYTRNGEYGAVFPYEYRNFFIPDTMRVKIPPNFSYKPNSGYFSNPALTISNSNVYQVGDTLLFINLKNFYTPFGGTITPTDEVEEKRIYFSISPGCNAVAGNYSGYTNTTGVGNLLNTPANNYKHLFGYAPSPATYTYTPPQISLSGGGTVISTDGTASWTVVLQNQSNLASAANSYFYISPVNSIANIVVREGATVITPDANGFYQLGTLAPSANRLFTVTGTTTNCRLDSMAVNASWGCNGYPTTFDASSCLRTIWLKVDAYQSQIQLSVTKQPVTTALPLCASETVEFVINSAQAAFADNPQFWAIPPVGLNISAGEIEYPLGSGNWQTITPILFAGTLIYSVEEHLQLQALYGTRGLPGTIDYPGTDRRQAKLRLSFTTDCNFTSGARMVVQQKADRPCGVGIPFNLGYNAIVRTDPIFVDGAMGTGSMSFNVTLSPANVSCGTVTVAGNVTPIGANTSITDTVVVNLPAGINYTGNFIGTPNASFASNTPGPAGSSIIKIKLASGITPGIPIPYSFDVTPNFNSGCATVAITSEAERSFAPLVCGATLCANPPKVIMGSTLNNITIQRPDIVIDNIAILSGTFVPASTITVNVAVTNSSAVTAPANSFQVEFFCGSSATAFATQSFSNIVPGNGSASASFTINIPASPVCNNGEVLMAVVRPSLASCVCSYSNLLVAGGLALPEKFLRFSANKINNTSLLNFSVAQLASGTVFSIERSADGKDFTTIGKIAATNTTDYSYTDIAAIKNATNYYRIKETSTTGKIFYSEVRVLSYKTDGKIMVYPIPVIETLNIELPDELLNQAVFIKIFNNNGQQVLHKNINTTSNVIAIDVASLHSGIYQVRVIPKNQAYSEKRASILKQ
jgi:hypothetical protein